MILQEKGSLAEYRYLEHGAFWAILALAGIMLASSTFHIPETVTGLIGGVLIAASLYWSIRRSRRLELQRRSEAADEGAETDANKPRMAKARSANKSAR